jgi:hypothetical protein
VRNAPHPGPLPAARGEGDVNRELPGRLREVLQPGPRPRRGRKRLLVPVWAFADMVVFLFASIDVGTRRILLL